MANNIKGITIEIGGNTSPLQNALKDVNKTSRDLQSELKEVNKQLKLDPTNTTLLNQKQKLLAESINNTKDKLSTLKEAEKQVEQQFKDGKIGEEQYRALQREISKTEIQLKNLEKQAGLSNAALNKISSVTDNVSKTTEKMGKSLLPVTVGIAAAGTAAVTAFNEVDEGSDIVIKKTGATGNAAKELENIYKDVASSVPDSLGDIGAAIGEINTRFEFTGDTLKTASEDFLKFAKINDIDVNSSVQLVSRAMGDAGIKSSEYNSVLDKLTVASQKSGIGIDSLTTNLAKYGAPMRALGIDTETSIAMFAGWEKAGVNTEIAFSGMKKAISNWGAAGKDSSVEFGKTLEAIKKAPNIATATSMAIDVFGQKAGPDLADAIKGGRFEIQDYVEALKKSGGAVNSTYDGIISGNDEAKIAMNSAKVAAAELGGTVLTMLAPILKDLATKAREISTMFSGLDENTKKTIMTILGIIAVMAPTLLIISKVAGLISAVTGAMAMMKTATMAQTIAQYGLNATLLASPITWIVLGITVLITIIILLWKNCEGFRNFWINLWNSIKEITGTIVNALVDFFTVKIPDAWNSLVSFFKGIPAWFNNLWTGIKTDAINVWNSIKLFFMTVWHGIVNGVMIIVNPFVKGITNLFDGMKTGLATIFNGLKIFFVGIWNAIKLIFLGPILLIIDLVTGNFTKLKSDAINIFNGLKNAFNQIWKGIELIFTGCIQAIVGFAIAAFNNAKGNIITIWNAVSGFLSNIWNTIKNIAVGAWNTLKNSIISTITGIKTGAINIFNSVLNFFRNLPSTLRNLGVSAFNGLKNGITSVLTTLGSAVRNGFNSAISFIKNLPSNMLVWGKDMIQGLINGIKSKISGVVDAVKGVGDKIRSFLHFSVPDEGPLTDYESWMPDFMSGLAKGIEKSKGIVTNSIKGLATDVNIGMKLNKNIPEDMKLQTSNNNPNFNNQNLIIPVYLDGKVIAQATAPYSDIIQGKSLKLEGRRVGIE